jgi:hypothetical protein
LGIVYRCLGAAIAVGALLLAAGPVVPAYMMAQRQYIVASAERHGLRADVVAAVLYNEMLGVEHRFIGALVPGDNAVAQALREGLLGWHFLTLKQAQWGGKGLIALAGGNTTVGPTGIRVSVGREIRHEVTVAGGRYQWQGLAERPSLVLDLMATPTAIEYLAANLERGLRRTNADQAGDWTALARWHNTGLTADRADVSRNVWNKGTRYVARVQIFLPGMTAMLNQPATPLWRVMLSGSSAPASPPDSGMAFPYIRPAAILPNPQ